MSVGLEVWKMSQIKFSKKVDEVSRYFETFKEIESKYNGYEVRGAGLLLGGKAHTSNIVFLKN